MRRKERAFGVFAAIRKYWPGLRDGQLEAGYAGIRPKLVGPGHPPADFVIQVRMNGSNVHECSISLRPRMPIEMCSHSTYACGGRPSTCCGPSHQRRS